MTTGTLIVQYCVAGQPQWVEPEDLVAFALFSALSYFDTKCQTKEKRKWEAHHLSLSPWAEQGCYWDILPSSLNRNVWWQNENKCRSQRDSLKGAPISVTASPSGRGEMELPSPCHTSKSVAGRGGVDRLFFAIFQMLFDIAEPIRVHYVDCLRTGRCSHSVNSQRALSYFISFPPPLERGGSCGPLITVMWVSPPNNNISVCITSYCCCSGSRRVYLGLGNSIEVCNLQTYWLIDFKHTPSILYACVFICLYRQCRCIYTPSYDILCWRSNWSVCHL